MRDNHGREWWRPRAATAWPTAHGLVLRNSRDRPVVEVGGLEVEGRAAVRAARTAVRDRDRPRVPSMAISMPWWKTRSGIEERNRSVVAQSTSPSILAACWRQTRWAMIEPIE